jgi:hypothetical protein
MRHATLTLLSLSQRTSIIQYDEAMSVFTHSGPGAVGEQNNGKLAAMLGLLSKLIRQSGRLRGNDPQRALCHPTILREASSSGAQIRNDTREDMEQTLHLQAQGLD